MDFDADRIYYSHQNLQQQQGDGGVSGANNSDASGRLEDEEDRAMDGNVLRRHFREFLSEFAVYLPLTFRDFCILMYDIVIIMPFLLYFYRKLSSGCQSIHLPRSFTPDASSSSLDQRHFPR